MPNLNHRHNGSDGSPRIDLRDLFGMIETVSVAPSAVPQTLYDQFKIYTNSTTYRFYWYDTTAGVWHYVTATA